MARNTMCTSAGRRCADRGVMTMSVQLAVRLTPREAEVLLMLARGRTYVQVADELGVSLNTPPFTKAAKASSENSRLTSHARQTK